MATPERRDLRNHGKFSKKFALPFPSRAIRNVTVNKPDLTKREKPPSYKDSPHYTVALGRSKKRKKAATPEVIVDSSKKVKHDAAPLVATDLDVKGKHAATSPVTLDSSKKSKHVTFNLDEKVDHADALPVYAVNTRPGFVACEATVLCDELWDELELKFLHGNEEGALEFAMLQSVYKLSFQDAISKHSTFGDFMREEISLRVADAGVV